MEFQPKIKTGLQITNLSRILPTARDEEVRMLEPNPFCYPRP